MKRKIKKYKNFGEKDSMNYLSNFMMIYLKCYILLFCNLGQYILQQRMSQQKRSEAKKEDNKNTEINNKKEHLQNYIIESALNEQNNINMNLKQESNAQQISKQRPELLEKPPNQQFSVLQYFKDCTPKNNSLNNQKVIVYMNLIANRIKNDFKQGILIIQDIKKELNLKNIDRNQIKMEEQLKRNLQLKRIQAIEKIKQIQQQEMNLKKMIVLSTDKLQKSKIKRNSSLTIRPPPDTQQEQFKKAILNHRKFIKQIQIKNELADKQNQIIAIKQLQQKQQFLKKRRQSKKMQAVQNLKLIVQRQRQRKLRIQEWKQKQKQIKQKKYLYIQNSIKEKQEIQAKMNQKHQFLQKLKSAHIYNKEQIQQHERRYDEMLQNRKNSIYSSKISQRSSQTMKHKQTKFSLIVKKELEELKKKQIQKNSKRKDHQRKKKISQYQQFVHQTIMPKLHIKQFVHPQRSQSLEALSAEGLRNAGLKNLQRAKKLKKSQSELKFYLLKKQSEQKLRIAKTKDSYKDYLKQVRKDIKYDPSQRQLKQILEKNRKRTHSDFDSLTKAKYISQYMVEKSPAMGDQKTYLAITKKLDLLKSIY